MSEEVEKKKNKPTHIYNFIQKKFIDLREIPEVKVSSGSYSILDEDKKLSIKSIILRKKRLRGYDRILFQSSGVLKSKEEESELKKDRHGFINYIKRRYQKQLPEELIDKSKQVKKQQTTSWSLEDIISYVENKNSKKAEKREMKKEEKKTKDKKKDKSKDKDDKEEQEKDNYNDDESLDQLNMNNDDDMGGDESGGGDDDD